MKFKTIEIELHKDLALLYLNRPQKLNAISSQMTEELSEAFRVLKETKTAVVVVTGRGRGFCAGVDVAEILKRQAQDAFERRNAALFDEVESYPGITIAAINGITYGGGVELVLACDFRFAVPEAVFCLPEITLGILPSAGGLRRLPPLIGFSRAKELILSSRKFTAKEALSFGLIHHCEPSGSLLNYSVEKGREMAQMNRDALFAAKAILNSAMQSTSREFIGMESFAQALLFEKRNKETEEDASSKR